MPRGREHEYLGSPLNVDQLARMTQQYVQPARQEYTKTLSMAPTTQPFLLAMDRLQYGPRAAAEAAANERHRQAAFAGGDEFRTIPQDNSRANALLNAMTAQQHMAQDQAQFERRQAFDESQAAAAQAQMDAYLKSLGGGGTETGGPPNPIMGPTAAASQRADLMQQATDSVGQMTSDAPMMPAAGAFGLGGLAAMLGQTAGRAVANAVGGRKPPGQAIQSLVALLENETDPRARAELEQHIASLVQQNPLLAMILQEEHSRALTGKPMKYQGSGKLIDATFGHP